MTHMTIQFWICLSYRLMPPVRWVISQTLQCWNQVEGWRLCWRVEDRSLPVACVEWDEENRMLFPQTEEVWMICLSLWLMQQRAVLPSLKHHCHAADNHRRAGTENDKRWKDLEKVCVYIFSISFISKEMEDAVRLAYIAGKVCHR